MRMREVQVKAKDLPPELRKGLDVDDQATCMVKITVVETPEDENMAKFESLMERFEENAVTVDSSPQDIVRRQRDIASGIISDDAK